MLEQELPVHPWTGQQALAVLPSGRIVWPIMGGAGDGGSGDDGNQDADDDGDGSTGDDSNQDGDDSGQDGDDSGQDDDSSQADDGQDSGRGNAQLAEAGRKALAAERTARRKADKARRDADKARREAEKARKAAEDQRDGLQAQLARLAGGGNGSNGDGDTAPAPDAEEIRREAEETAGKRYAERVLRSEIRAAAAGKMNDPADALRLLDLTQFEAGDDGEFDQEEITSAIDDLVKDKPYLALPAATAGRFQGTGDGGARDRPRKKSQLTRAEVQRMKPAEITKAKAEGRLDDLLAGKT